MDQPMNIMNHSIRSHLFDKDLFFIAHGMNFIKIHNRHAASIDLFTDISQRLNHRDFQIKIKKIYHVIKRAFLKTDHM
ncbi:hypothetical protein NB688_002550 [Xanthomonas sacchari]|uniref:Uncharacterized protein n=1 Tax=Xanthomonas sacchari TaxID=56458 RepID=A0ABT3DUG2_9XANT|nr:hypothetical protein [Xanthomonas sacchari]MCW0420384.1 hypothetical protein [Xanthomonas sacchari]